MRTQWRRLVGAATLLGAVAWATAAHAQIIQYTLSGGSQGGELWVVEPGSNVTAILRYDLAAEDLAPDDSTLGIYDALSFDIAVDGQNLSCPAPQIVVTTDIEGDFPGGPADFDVGFWVECPTPLTPGFVGENGVVLVHGNVVLVALAAGEGPIDSDALPDESILPDFPVVAALLRGDAPGDGPGETVPNDLTADLTVIIGEVDDGSSVAELLETLIADVAALNLQAGISNALDAKLDAARQALDDVNQQNDVAAVNALNALLNAIEAQRGKKLTEQEADFLSAQVVQVIAAIQGGAGA